MSFPGNTSRLKQFCLVEAALHYLLLRTTKPPSVSCHFLAISNVDSPKLAVPCVVLVEDKKAESSYLHSLVFFF